MVGKGYFFHKNTMRTLITLLFISMSFWLNAAVVSVGSGSYTTTFPGTDAAGRNQFPPGTPQLSGTASGKPVPTNDWWSNLLVSDHVSNLFPHPLALRTNNQGLVLTYIPRGVMDAVEPIVIGVSGLNAALTALAEQGIQMIYDETHLILAQGNFVLAVSEGTYGGAPTSYYDLWRVEDGKIAEHWDVMETIADQSTWQNDNGKF